MVRLTWHDVVDTVEADAIRALLASAAVADGRPAVSEYGLLRVRPHAATGSVHLLATADEGGLVGYAQIEPADGAYGPASAEFAVHPAWRRRGVGTALVTALLERVGLPEHAPSSHQPGLVDTPGGESLRVWAHGEHPGATRLAEHFGFLAVRRLLRMRCELAGTLPTVQLPPGASLRTFVPGQDEQAIVEVNSRAFSWHPEQGRMTVRDLQLRAEESWFDPAGFLLAVDESGRVLGFHWTKIHRQPPSVPAEPPSSDTGRDLGEVYVVGVDPAAQGGGLGTALTLAGLHYLRERGLRSVLLYVEADNNTAIKVYEKLGFAVWDADVQFAR